MGACRYTQQTENTTTQVEDIFVEYTFGFSLFRLYLLGNNLYRMIGTVHLTDTARDTFMITFGIEFKRKGCSEPLAYFQCLPIFGILFGNLRGNNLRTGYFHCHKETPKTFPEVDKVIF